MNDVYTENTHINSFENSQNEFGIFSKECQLQLINKGYSPQELNANIDYFKECFDNKVPINLTVSYYKSNLK